jgi:hypothetical protein
MARERQGMRLVWVLLIATGLTACASEPEPSLALACQMTKCTCLPKGSISFLAKPVDRSVPVLWKLNGDAYCPADYVLRRAGEK